ncbi:MAG: hypothetical protein V1907_01010 [Candidatus Kerfeldbacteria bacterium]
MKRFNITALVSALLLVTIGVLNFFITFPYDVKFGVAQSLVHIAIGLLGLFMATHLKTYLLGLGVGGSLLSVLGFAGLDSLLGFIDLATYITYVYAIIGIASILAYLDERSRIPERGSPRKQPSQ